MALTPDELQRYSRQLILPELGIAGQERLARARVLVVGVGGLGAPVALYLAAAGVGTLVIVDDDRVEPSNLHRQVLYRVDDLGRPKVAVAAETLQRLNPSVRVEAIAERFDAGNARALVESCTVVLDGTDNFETRYRVNEACVATGRPNVFASVLRFSGQLTVLGAEGGPCYRCLFPDPPPVGSVPSCAEAGVLGVLPGLMGTLQATEAIKLITGIGDPLVGRLLLVDAQRMRFREMRVERRPDCPECGTGVRTTAPPVPTCDAPVPADVGELSPAAVVARRVEEAPVQLLDVREGWERAIVEIPGSIHIPLGELVQRVGELDPTVTTVVYCHHGARSMAAAQYMVTKGFRKVWNLEGGIDRWSLEVEGGQGRY